MPITDIIILSVIVFAFLAFAVVLGWGDIQTKEIARLSREHALFGSDAHVVALRPSVEAGKGRTGWPTTTTPHKCPEGGRSIIVVINDGGPFVRGHIIDLTLGRPPARLVSTASAWCACLQIA